MMSRRTVPAEIVLTATNDFGATRVYTLQPDQGVFVGKSSNCGLQLPDDALADIQCRVGFEDGKLCVQNWMSAEGTRVNGKPISANAEVRLGDTIQIGQHRIVVADANTAKATPVSEQKESDEDCQSTLASDEAAAAGAEELPASTSLRDKGEPESALGASHASVGVESDRDEPVAESVDFGSDFFEFQEEETYDRETVALLQAEIEDLQAALAQRDAEQYGQSSEQPSQGKSADSTAEQSDEMLRRMQELIDEANRSDERVAILEEILHASEDASRSDHEERHQLEAWVGDIEKRIGQREEEHTAEIETLRQRLEESSQQQERLQRQLQQAAFSGNAPQHYEETLENLQRSNKQLQEDLSESQKHCHSLQQRLEDISGEQERTLREERASIAKEQAKISRLRYELSSKLTAIEELPKEENHVDKETSHRIQTLRQHLREIHEQEKQEEKEASLATRLSKLWKRVEY